MGVPYDLRIALADYRRLLTARFGLRLRSLRLFGSQARGNADNESDADVAVVIEGLTEAERKQAIDLAMQAWKSSGARCAVLSPLVWSDTEAAFQRRRDPDIAFEIDHEGIPV